MNDAWLDFAIRIQSIAQAGLQYGKDKYDIERYEELRRISAEMIAVRTDIPVAKVYDLFCNETGYQTPKVDTRAAVFVDGKILLVHENNGTWSLPGGWCDVDQSVASNTVKEVKEEREVLYEEMIGMGIKAYKSQANFILFYSEIENLSQKLIDRGVLIRKFGGKLENYYRVTIGDKEENSMFVGAIRDILKKEK